MAAGLKIWDAQGRVVVDTSTMLPRSVIIGEVTGDGSASIIPIAQGTNIGVPSIRPLDQTTPPEVEFDGPVLRWNGKGRAYRAELSVVLI